MRDELLGGAGGFEKAHLDGEAHGGLGRVESGGRDLAIFLGRVSELSEVGDR